MESSRSTDLSFTLPARKHASSISSTTSSNAPTSGIRKLTLTIPPLKIRSALVQTPSTAEIPPPQENAEPSSSSSLPGPSAIRPKHLLKIKPKSSLSSAVTTAEPSPAPELPPPPTPPPVTPQLVKAPRPVKLKPLKEVLMKLIAQIKKKDVYGFFLQPVDPEQVSGYSDIVKNPMDFGTMGTKVEQGRYRSLEQFTHDFNLVISNARAFNPPDTIYHSEAGRIEVWGLEHITKASSQVIEYETDWTIDIVADGEPIASTSAITIDGQDLGTPNVKMEEDAFAPQRTRSPSVVSSNQGPTIDKGKRARGKKAPVVLESFEPGNHLPGFRDGLGVFPPKSDLAELMVSLKLRGQRRITKKQRLKLEKEGPPFFPDGSLAFDQMEYPFNAFQNIVPDSLQLPQMVPLVSCQPPPPPAPSLPETAEGTPVPEFSQPPEDRPTEQKLSLDAVAIPPEKMDTIFANAGRAIPAVASASFIGKKRLKHWSVVRNPPRRAKEAEETEDAFARLAKRRRTIESTDYGSLAMLLGTLAVERGVKAEHLESIYPTEYRYFDGLRLSLRDPSSSVNPSVPSSSSAAAASALSETSVGERKDMDLAIESEDYVRDVVYGGVDGLAYFRSLAEFVAGSTYTKDKLSSDGPGSLGMSLSDWVETRIIDPLTNGYHSLLRNTVKALSDPSSGSPELRQMLDDALSGQVKLEVTENKNNSTMTGDDNVSLASLADPNSQIEIASLLHAPHELFLAETEWAGANYKPKREREREEKELSMMKENAIEFLAYTIQEEAKKQQQQKQQQLGQDTIANVTKMLGALAGDKSVIANANTRQANKMSQSDLENSPTDMLEVIEHALNSGAETIEELDRRLRESAASRESPNGANGSADGEHVPEDVSMSDASKDGTANAAVSLATTSATIGTATPAIAGTAVSGIASEDPLLRKTRLNLLAIAKRAPIDRIARLPPDLVPAHIRHIVPTLPS